MPPRAGKANFQPVHGRRSFEEVAEQIREQIRQGKIGEGDRLPAERELSASLGVSRNTLREALRGLERSGLIVQKPGAAGGAFVASGNGGAIKAAFEDLVLLGTIQPADLTHARIVIGREVTKLACAHHDAADLQALRDNVAETEAAAAKGNLKLRVELSLEFYKLLARAGKSPVLTILTNVLTDITMEFVRVIGTMPNEFVVSHRRRLLDHLERRDSDGAVEEMDTYLRTTMRAYLERRT